MLRIKSVWSIKMFAVHKYLNTFTDHFAPIYQKNFLGPLSRTTFGVGGWGVGTTFAKMVKNDHWPSLTILNPKWSHPPPGWDHFCAHTHTYRLMVIPQSVWSRPFGTTCSKIQKNTFISFFILGISSAVFYHNSFQVVQNTWEVCNLYFMNYYLKESSEIFLLKYLKCTKITIFVVISPKLGKKYFKAKKSTKKHIKNMSKDAVIDLNL